MSDHRRSRRSDRYRAEDQATGRYAPVPRQGQGDAQQRYAPEPTRRVPYERPRQPAGRKAPVPRKHKAPFYRSPVLMLILLLVLPPVGIFLLWKFGRQMRTVKLVLTIISVLWLALLVFLLTRNLRATPDAAAPPADPSGVEMTVTGPQDQITNANDSLVQTVDIFSGSDVVGKRAFLTIPTEATQDFTGKELAVIADTYVQGREYSWFTVVLDDGSGEGYVFSGNTTDTVVNGLLADDGTISEPFVTLYRDGNDYVE